MQSNLCSHCGKTFSDKKNFQIHMRRCIDKRIFHCEQCDKDFVGRVSHSNHLATHRRRDCKHCGMRVPAFHASSNNFLLRMT